MGLARWRTVLGLRLRSLFRRDAVEQDLADEFADHIARAIDQNVAAGMTRAAAEAAARREFGNVAHHQEEVRDARGVSWVEQLLHDLAFSARLLRKSPAFTAVAVLTLALGIGANTAIFTVIRSVLLRPSPYPHPERLVAIFETEPHGNVLGVSKLDLQDWRPAASSFSGLAASGGFYARLKDPGGAGIPVAAVSTEFFDVLGVRPLLGSPSREVDETVVISDGFWKRQFGADPHVVGRTLIMNDTARVVSAVMPPHFDYPHGADAWIPQDMVPKVKAARVVRFWSVVGSLRPGATIESAQAEMSAIAARLADVYPATNRGVGVKVMDLEESITGKIKPTVVLVAGIAALVLLIACANLANLMLVRGVTRRRELAVRMALGATRQRLRRQLLTESLFLALAGTLVGLPVPLWVAYALQHSQALYALPVSPNVSYGWIFVAALLIAIGATTIFGALPALRAARVDVVTDLKQAGGHGATAIGLSGALVASEIALATVLLVAAALAGRSLARLQGERIGFDPEHAVGLFPSWSRSGASRFDRDRDLIARLRSMPDIQSAALGDHRPFFGMSSAGTVILEADTSTRAGLNQALFRVVGSDYFRTLGIPFGSGRDFRDSGDSAANAVIVSESAARTFWPGQNPIGQRLAMPEMGDSSLWLAHNRGIETWLTVVGVVGDVRDQGLGIPPVPTAYRPADAIPYDNFGIVVRSDAPPARLRAELLSAASAVDPGSKSEVESMGDLALQSVQVPRIRAFTVSAFAALALLLTAIGIYGVTAHATTQRTAEIGIRMALGATAWQVLVSVSKKILVSAIAGLTIGVALALAGARFAASLLYGIGPHDAIALGIAAIGMTVIALLSAWIPARRATLVDPTEALRAE